MTGSRQDHWLDRIAVAYTRRQVLRGAAAGAVLALPFMRATAAAASAGDTDPTACRTGCAYTAHREAEATVSACRAAPTVSDTVAFSEGYLMAGLGLFSLPLSYYQEKRGAAARQQCIDSAIVQMKANYYNCLQPNCPGFDPKKPGGPCDTCSANCCPDPNVVDGYSCCLQCGKSGGCCYSVSGQC